MYKPSEQGLRLLEVLRAGDVPLDSRQNYRRVVNVCNNQWTVSEGYVAKGRWVHHHPVGPYWPSNLVEALKRANLIDYNGEITEEGKVAHLPPSSRSFSKPSPVEEPSRTGLLPAAIAAYAWYFESCRKAGEDPKSFIKWRKFVTDEQIRDMVRVYRLPID